MKSLEINGQNYEIRVGETLSSVMWRMSTAGHTPVELQDILDALPPGQFLWTLAPFAIGSMEEIYAGAMPITLHPVDPQHTPSLDRVWALVHAHIVEIPLEDIYFTHKDARDACTREILDDGNVYLQEYELSKEISARIQYTDRLRQIISLYEKHLDTVQRGLISIEAESNDGET